MKIEFAHPRRSMTCILYTHKSKILRTWTIYILHSSCHTCTHQHIHLNVDLTGSMMVDEHPWDKNESFVIWPGLPYVALDPRSEGESRDLRRTQEDPGGSRIRCWWWISPNFHQGFMMVIHGCSVIQWGRRNKSYEACTKKGMHVQLGWCLKNLEFPLAFVFIDQLV